MGMRALYGIYGNTTMSDIRIILDNIRSTHNVGSIFRTAETAGVSRIYCVGTTPAPVDRFGRARPDIAKVSLGAEKMVAWEYVEEVEAGKLIKQLKKEGFKIVAVEQDERSVHYRGVGENGDEKLAFIFGNEVGGVSKKLLKVADVIAEIPMKGEKESLNVSVAVGVVLFGI
jgi:23S rRNA (guanosine2251-2'-O)-methyltransferase